MAEFETKVTTLWAVRTLCNDPETLLQIFIAVYLIQASAVNYRKHVIINVFRRYTKLSATIACTAELEILVRNFYFEEMMNSIRDNLSQKPEPVLTELNECFKIVSATLLPSERGVYITDNKVQCCLVVESNMPKDITCTRAAISIEVFKIDKVEKRTAAKSYKTDLSVNNNIGSQNNSPRKSAPDDNELPNLISR